MAKKNKKKITKYKKHEKAEKKNGHDKVEKMMNDPMMRVIENRTSKKKY